MNSTSIPMHFTSGSTVPHGYTNPHKLITNRLFTKDIWKEMGSFYFGPIINTILWGYVFSNAHAPNAF